MFNIFMAGPDRVCWEVTAVGQDGPFRLALHHAQGSIVEYFSDVTGALLRQQELEQLLIAAKSGLISPPNTRGDAVGQSVC
jgi:hypothetical protein